MNIRNKRKTGKHEVLKLITFPVFLIYTLLLIFPKISTAKSYTVNPKEDVKAGYGNCTSVGGAIVDDIGIDTASIRTAMCRGSVKGCSSKGKDYCSLSVCRGKDKENSCSEFFFETNYGIKLTSTYRDVTSLVDMPGIYSVSLCERSQKGEENKHGYCHLDWVVFDVMSTIDKTLENYEMRKEYYPSGKLKSENYYRKINGMFRRHGPRRIYFESGALKEEENYKNEWRHGERKVYYENGALRFVENYENAYVDGVSKDYYESGQLRSETPHVRRQIHGLARFYRPDGCIKMEILYENYKLKKKKKFRKNECPYASSERAPAHTKHREYFPNGGLRFEVPLKDGQFHGTAFYYYEEGPVEMKLEYKDGKVEGIARDYYKTGVLRTKETYLNDILHGPAYEFDEKGKLKSKTIYRNNKAVKGEQ